MRRIAIATAGIVLIGAAIAGTYSVQRRRLQQRRTAAGERVRRECFKPRQVADRAELLHELALHRRWIALFEGGATPMNADDWCIWSVEKEMGLRADLRPGPPAAGLPIPRPLVGARRGEILEALGDPGCGDWEKKPGGGMRFVPQPCAKSSRLAYAFYDLPPRWAGGGPELTLVFDDDGLCSDARWIIMQ
jgi:hypothetical protein